MGRAAAATSGGSDPGRCKRLKAAAVPACLPGRMLRRGRAPHLVKQVGPVDRALEQLAALDLQDGAQVLAHLAHAHTPTRAREASSREEHGRMLRRGTGASTSVVRGLNRGAGYHSTHALQARVPSASPAPHRLRGGGCQRDERRVGELLLEDAELLVVGAEVVACRAGEASGGTAAGAAGPGEAVEASAAKQPQVAPWPRLPITGPYTPLAACTHPTGSSSAPHPRLCV